MTHSRTSVPAQSGFTLIELLVAVGILALMTVMGWRALDGMQDANARTRDHADAVLALEAGLAQWGTDLDALMELPQTPAIDWDGRVLRITRRPSGDATEGVLVVAWTRANRDGVDQWLRWQSTPARTRADWQTVWQAAAQWAQSPGDTARQREVALVPLAQWQLYYSRDGAWSNPLSSAGAPGAGATPAGHAPVPDGVRLVLQLPATHPLAGTLTRDWVRPTLSSSAP